MDSLTPVAPSRTHSIVRTGVASLALVALGLVGTQLMKSGTTPGDALPPNPFVSQTSNLRGALTSLGQKNSIEVKRVTFNLPSEKSVTGLTQNVIYLVEVPNDNSVQTVTLDQAMTLAGMHNVNYYGYKYQSSDASLEKMNASAATFAQRFPGTFFASTKARNEDAAHGNGLAIFEAEHGITFAPTNGTAGSVSLQKNTLYAVVVNEETNATITVVQPAECGNALLEEGEACDDGDTQGGDGCSSMCSVEIGYSCTQASPSVCTLDPYCGDGVQNGSEQCDDGNSNNNDYCNTSCQMTTPLPF